MFSSLFIIFLSILCHFNIIIFNIVGGCRQLTAAASPPQMRIRFGTAPVVYCCENSDTHPHIQHCTNRAKRRHNNNNKSMTYICQGCPNNTRLIEPLNTQQQLHVQEKRADPPGTEALFDKPPTQFKTTRNQRSGVTLSLRPLNGFVSETSWIYNSEGNFGFHFNFSGMGDMICQKVQLVQFLGSLVIHEAYRRQRKLRKQSWLVRLTAFPVSAYYLLISAVTEAAQRHAAL